VQRKLYPKVHFYSGIIQRALGIPVSLFARILAVARTGGRIQDTEQGGQLHCVCVLQYQGNDINSLNESRFGSSNTSGLFTTLDQGSDSALTVQYLATTPSRKAKHDSFNQVQLIKVFRRRIPSVPVDHDLVRAGIQAAALGRLVAYLVRISKEKAFTCRRITERGWPPSGGKR
jgi:hypothetical protein